MNPDSASRVGMCIASILRGAWRTEPPPLAFSEADLARVTSSLVNVGAGALAWWRIRNTSLDSCPTAKILRLSYLQQTMSALMQKQVVEEVVHTLDDAGIPFLVTKGWAIARRYAESKLRTMPDLNLLVPFKARARVLGAIGAFGLGEVRVHVREMREEEGYFSKPAPTFDMLYRRSEQIPIAASAVRIPAEEDHLALLCIDFLRQGARNPLGLCDVAVAVEGCSTFFDWDGCIGIAPRADWIACTIGLAHQLLDADLHATPAQVRAEQLPGWLVAAVLKEWSNVSVADGPHSTLSRYDRSNLRWLSARLEKWLSNPIIATVRLKGAFDDLPRLPYQLGDAILRARDAMLRPISLRYESAT